MHTSVFLSVCACGLCVSVTEEASGHRLGAGHGLLPLIERNAVVTLWTVLFNPCH